MDISGNTLRRYFRDYQQRGIEKFKYKADDLGIELIYLLAYSPNLNFIEILWKFVKNKYFPQYLT